MAASNFHPVEMTDDCFDDDDDMGHVERDDRPEAAHHDNDDERFESDSNCSLPLLADGTEHERDFDAPPPGFSSRCRYSAAIFLFCAVFMAAFATKRGDWPIPSSILSGGSRIQPIKDGEETTSSPKAVHVVYSSDDESLAGVEASIKSVIDHASGPVAFHYVGNTPLPPIPGADVHFKDLSRVARKYHLGDYMNPVFERGHGMTGLNTNPANFVRFAIHEFLPSQSKQYGLTQTR